MQDAKSDPIDAEVAARNVLARQAQGGPKAGQGPAEALRQLRSTRRAAIKSRTQATNLLHGLLLVAPADLRADLAGGTITTRCARLRQGTVTNEWEACKMALRCAARPAAGNT